MDDQPVHNKPPPSQNGGSKKLFFKSSMLLNVQCGIQVSHHNQQQRPLPSLLSVSFFHATQRSDFAGLGQAGRWPLPAVQLHQPLPVQVRTSIYPKLIIQIIDRPTKHSLPLTKFTKLSSELTLGVILQIIKNQNSQLIIFFPEIKKSYWILFMKFLL